VFGKESDNLCRVLPSRCFLEERKGELGMATALSTPTVEQARTPSLTSREIEVLRLITEGKSSLQVAELLYLSKRTVDFHLARIYEKLNVQNRVQAIRRAVELGLVPPLTLA